LDQTDVPPNGAIQPLEVVHLQGDPSPVGVSFLERGVDGLRGVLVFAVAALQFSQSLRHVAHERGFEGRRKTQDLNRLFASGADPLGHDPGVVKAGNPNQRPAGFNALFVDQALGFFFPVLVEGIDRRRILGEVQIAFADQPELLLVAMHFGHAEDGHGGKSGQNHRVSKEDSGGER
jgi:hypothetical protein